MAAAEILLQFFFIFSVTFVNVLYDSRDTYNGGEINSNPLRLFLIKKILA